MQPLDLPVGYYELPKGRLANVVTCLEMTSRPQSKDASLPAGHSLRPVDVNDLATYRALFRRFRNYLFQFLTVRLKRRFFVSVSQASSHFNSSRSD